MKSTSPNKQTQSTINNATITNKKQWCWHRWTNRANSKNRTSEYVLAARWANAKGWVGKAFSGHQGSNLLENVILFAWETLIMSPQMDGWYYNLGSWIMRYTFTCFKKVLTFAISFTNTTNILKSTKDFTSSDKSAVTE